MLQAIADKKPIVSVRTPAALEFADRLRQLGVDIHLIALAVEAACKMGDDEDGAAIVLALRKLQGQIEELADQVLPPLTREQRKVLEGLRPEVRQ